VISCPQCKKSWPDSAAACATCLADLSLLAHFASGLSDKLERADRATREGMFKDAVTLYLAVLEIDPDNATAKERLGEWAAAVRAFDRPDPQPQSQTNNVGVAAPPPPPVPVDPPTIHQPAPPLTPEFPWAMVLIGIGLFVSGFALGFLSHPW
jgi:hypothetical protein